MYYAISISRTVIYRLFS